MNMSSSEIVSPPKYLIKPTNLLEQSRPFNIFKQEAPQSPSQFHSLTFYSIVGDQNFRKQYLNKHSPMNTTINDTIQANNLNLTTTIPRDTIISKFPAQSKFRLTRDFRTSMKAQKNKQDWNNLNKYLKRRINKSQTVCQSTFKEVYVHPNPQKIDLINDNIPQYWKHSLRNNNKRLKSYLKGNPFKQTIAEEMLQTIKGTKKLQASIPKISHLKDRTKRLTLIGRNHSKYSFIEQQKKKQLSYDNKHSKTKIEIGNISTKEEVYKIKYKPQFRWMGIQGI